MKMKNNKSTMRARGGDIKGLEGFELKIKDYLQTKECLSKQLLD